MGFLSSVGSLFSSLGSGLSSGSLPLGDWSGGWTNFSSNQSKLKDAYNRQYDYSHRYALESPSWVVQGLRNAGLNPILALQDGSITGASTPNPTLPSGDGSGQFSLGGKSKAERELISSQINTAKKTGENLEVNSDKLRNDIEVAKAHVANETALNNARIENIKADTFQKEHGFQGVWSPLATPTRVLYDFADKVKSFGSAVSNSAKDWFKGKEAVEKLPRSSIKDAPDWVRSVIQRERDKDSHEKAYRHHH